MRNVAILAAAVLLVAVSGPKVAWAQCDIVVQNDNNDPIDIIIFRGRESGEAINQPSTWIYVAPKFSETIQINTMNCIQELDILVRHRVQIGQPEMIYWVLSRPNLSYLDSSSHTPLHVLDPDDYDPQNVADR